MSAPEPVVTPVVEEVVPAVEAAEPKPDESGPVAEVVAPAVEAEVAAEEPPVEGDKEEEPKKESAPKSPSFLTKLFNFKKGKVAKSPKKDNDAVEAPVIAEAVKEAPVEPSAEAPAEAVEAVQEAEAVVAEPAVAPEVSAVASEEVKEEPAVPKSEGRALKLSRRLSARVSDLFKPKPKAEVATPAKVDEYPPKIDEPVPVAPLENPASEEAAKLEAQAPVVAAAA